MGEACLTAKLVAASSQPLLWPKHSTQSCTDCRQASTITVCRCFLVMPSRAAMVYKLPRKWVSACLRETWKGDVQRETILPCWKGLGTVETLPKYTCLGGLWKNGQ